ncbi:MAG TPA: response regulator, partial [Roseiflexaceae bacterium]
MSSRNLLVVDDDPAVIELLTSVLRRDDRHIVGAYDCRTALDEIRRAPYDLMVAGLSRNGVDGLDLLRRARQLRPQTPVILAAETSDPARVIRAIRERAYSFFHKPLPPGAVADMVQQALAASAWQDDIEVVAARPEWLRLLVRC